MMKVEGLKKERVEIEIDPRDFMRKVISQIEAGYRLGGYDHVWLGEDGKLWAEYEVHTSHSWSTKEIVDENPSKEKLAALERIKALREVIHLDL